MTSTEIGTETDVLSEVFRSHSVEGVRCEDESTEAVVLAGTYRWRRGPFESLTPRPLLPVAQQPIISYSLRWLRHSGISRATVCANTSTVAVRRYLGDGSRFSMHLKYYEDIVPRGAAGCARDVIAAARAQTFVIADGTAVSSVDLSGLLAHHRTQHAAMTVVVDQSGAEIPGHSAVSPVDVYVVERRVLDLVQPKGFEDIKETLVPRLHHLGARIATFRAAAPCPRVLNAQSYLAVNLWILEQLGARHVETSRAGSMCSLMAAESAYVSSDALLVGPVMLGAGAVIEPDATLVGPVSIGPDSHVERGAVVSRSVLWRRSRVPRKAVVHGCILIDDACVEPGTTVVNQIVTTNRHNLRSPRTELSVADGEGQRRHAVT